MAGRLLLASSLRNENVYRTVHGTSAPVRSCGFMLKPTSRGSYSNRVMKEFVAVYLLRGSGTFTDWNQQEHAIAAGDLVLLPAGRPHGVVQKTDGQWAEAYITLDGGFGSDLQRLGVLPSERYILHPGVDAGLVEQFERILRELANLPDNALPSVLLQVHQLLSLAGDLHRKKRSSDRHQEVVDRACLLLSRGLHEQLEMETVAADLGLSYERFRKLFRQRIGIAPGDYRIRRRIDKARALIWQHGYSNKQVAYELGYPDPFTFSKQFRKVTGVWPEEYRRSLDGK